MPRVHGSRPRRSGLRLAAAALAAIAAAVVSAHALSGAGTPRAVATIADPELTEASGLAASRRAPALLWAQDDSGNPPWLHAVGIDGRPRGVVAVAGANRDWEDLAAFELGGVPYLLIADVGDNSSAEPFVTLLAVPEPDPAALSPASPLAVAPAWRIRLRYPDGPADCEAVAVDAAEGRVYLLTKRTRPPRLYSVPLRPAGDAPVTATLEAALEAFPRPEVGLLALPLPTGRYRGQPTGMDLAPDGSGAAVLTYGQVLYFPRRAGERWAEALARAPVALGAPGLRQAEAIAFSADGRALWVTGEGRHPPLLRFTVPGPGS